jgi:protein-S-isoprenylcysteine O-methyltransferase Ste14
MDISRIITSLLLFISGLAFLFNNIIVISVGLIIFSIVLLLTEEEENKIEKRKDKIYKSRKRKR